MIQLEDISLEGISLKGISLEGISLEGISLEGISLEGPLDSEKVPCTTKAAAGYQAAATIKAPATSTCKKHEGTCNKHLQQATCNKPKTHLEQAQDMFWRARRARRARNYYFKKVVE